MTTPETGLVSGPELSPEGGAVGLPGGSDAGADEEHGSVRRRRAQNLHEGSEAPLTNESGRLCPA